MIEYAQIRTAVIKTMNIIHR